MQVAEYVYLNNELLLNNIDLLVKLAHEYRDGSGLKLE